MSASTKTIRDSIVEHLQMTVNAPHIEFLIHSLSGTETLKLAFVSRVSISGQIREIVAQRGGSAKFSDLLLVGDDMRATFQINDTLIDADIDEHRKKGALLRLEVNKRQL